MIENRCITRSTSEHGGFFYRVHHRLGLHIPSDALGKNRSAPQVLLRAAAEIYFKKYGTLVLVPIESEFFHSVKIIGAW
jgi:hypothetical protein